EGVLIDLVALEHDAADHRVEPRAVAAAGQDADFHEAQSVGSVRPEPIAPRARGGSPARHTTRSRCRADARQCRSQGLCCVQRQRVKDDLAASVARECSMFGRARRMLAGVGVAAVLLTTASGAVAGEDPLPPGITRLAGDNRYDTSSA